MQDRHGPFTETVLPGAFADAENADVVLRYGHEGIPLASTRGKNLRVWEDDEGLKFRAQIDATSPYAKSVISAISRGDVTEASFAGRIEKYKWADDYSAVEISKISVDRGDVTVCQFGANPETGATIGELGNVQKMLSELVLENMAKNIFPESGKKL